MITVLLYLLNLNFRASGFEASLKSNFLPLEKDWKMMNVIAKTPLCLTAPQSSLACRTLRCNALKEIGS